MDRRNACFPTSRHGVSLWRAASRSAARLLLLYVVYNMEDEVDVDIEGDEFHSNVRSEYFLNIRV